MLFWVVLINAATRLAAVGFAAWLSGRFLARSMPQTLAFATGLLVTMACMHLLPEAAGQAASLWTLGLTAAAAALAFALAGWTGHRGRAAGTRRGVGTLLLGIGCHNLIDGILVAGAFAGGFASGLVVSVAVMIHEMPQDLAEIAVLEKLGLARRRAVAAAAAAALLALPGAAAGWLALQASRALIPYALAVSAVSFLYIALAEILPALLREKSRPALWIGGAAGVCLSALMCAFLDFA